MSKLNYHTDKTVVIIVVVMLVLLIGAVISTIIVNNNKKTFGDTIEMIGLKEGTKGKPNKIVLQEFVQYQALRVINLNSKEQKASKDIKDAAVRARSLNQSYDKDVGLHRITFILDIKSLKQSYDVSYGWIDESREPNEYYTENISYVKCLPPDKLIYGEFDCIDFNSVVDAPSDPILKHLPHSTLNYRITLDPSLPYTLSVVISTTAADERGDANAAISRYKEQVLDWIHSVGLDPQDYTINYTYKRASVY